MWCNLTKQTTVAKVPFFFPLSKFKHFPLVINSQLTFAEMTIPDGTPQKKYYGQRGGIIHTFLKIQRQDGWRGFYRGLSINLVRTVPNAAVTFLTYELIMRNLN